MAIRICPLAGALPPPASGRCIASAAASAGPRIARAGVHFKYQIPNTKYTCNTGQTRNKLLEQWVLLTHHTAGHSSRRAPPPHPSSPASRRARVAERPLSWGIPRTRARPTPAALTALQIRVGTAKLRIGLPTPQGYGRSILPTHTCRLRRAAESDAGVVCLFVCLQTNKQTNTRSRASASGKWKSPPLLRLSLLSTWLWKRRPNSVWALAR